MCAVFILKSNHSPAPDVLKYKNLEWRRCFRKILLIMSHGLFKKISAECSHQPLILLCKAKRCQLGVACEKKRRNEKRNNLKIGLFKDLSE